MLCYHNILVAPARPDRKATSVVGVQVADVLDMDMEFIYWYSLERIVVWWASRPRRLVWRPTGSGLCQAKSRACLDHVDLECLIGHWVIFCRIVVGEAWPGFEITRPSSP